MRVLVVADDRALADVFEDFLRQLGHDPIVVRTAEAGVARVYGDQPDAVLLDIHLPGMSGLEFLEIVGDARVPVVAVSGVATESQARECLRLGAFDFLAKPVALDRLRQILLLLEPAVRSRRLETAGVRASGRRAQRATVALPVRVYEYDGVHWQATSINVSASGMKIRPVRQMTPGRAVTLAFRPPDGQPALEVASLLVRTDLDGCAFSFRDVSDSQLQRLNAFVRRVASRTVAPEPSPPPEPTAKVEATRKPGPGRARLFAWILLGLALVVGTAVAIGAFWAPTAP